MKLQEIYAKDINRNIQGVIKVDDDRDKSIKQELEEYVAKAEDVAGQIKPFDLNEMLNDIPDEE